MAQPLHKVHAHRVILYMSAKSMCGRQALALASQNDCGAKLWTLTPTAVHRMLQQAGFLAALLLAMHELLAPQPASAEQQQQQRAGAGEASSSDALMPELQQLARDGETAGRAASGEASGPSPHQHGDLDGLAELSLRESGSPHLASCKTKEVHLSWGSVYASWQLWQSTGLTTLALLSLPAGLKMAGGIVYAALQLHSLSRHAALVLQPIVFWLFAGHAGSWIHHTAQAADLRGRLQQILQLLMDKQKIKQSRPGTRSGRA